MRLKVKSDVEVGQAAVPTEETGGQRRGQQAQDHSLSKGHRRGPGSCCSNCRLEWGCGPARTCFGQHPVQPAVLPVLVSGARVFSSPSAP